MKKVTICAAAIAIAGVALFVGCKKDAKQTPLTHQKGALATGPDSSGGEKPPIPPK